MPDDAPSPSIAQAAAAAADTARQAAAEAADNPRLAWMQLMVDTVRQGMLDPQHEGMRRWNPDSCLAASRIVLEVLGYFGVPAKPQPVSTGAFNQAGLEHFLNKIPVSEWPPEAWSVGVGGTGALNTAEARWDGHMVILAEGRWLLDASADQMARPERNILVQPFAAPLTPDWEDGGAVLTSPDSGTTLVYWLPDEDPGGWKASPDWKNKGKRLDRHIAMTIRAMKAVGAPPPA